MGSIAILGAGSVFTFNYFLLKNPLGFSVGAAVIAGVVASQFE